DVDAARSGATDLEIRLEAGTPVRFHVARGAQSPVDFLLADATGLPLRVCSAFPSSPERLRLQPGSYRISYVEDDTVVSTETFDVGTEPVVKEVRRP